MNKQGRTLLLYMLVQQALGNAARDIIAGIWVGQQNHATYECAHFQKAPDNGHTQLKALARRAHKPQVDNIQR